MEGKKLFKAFLMGLAFLIGYVFILVSEYGLFTGDGSPLATMMPWVFVLGMLFYSTFHSKKMKYVFGIGAFIFISLVLQVLYGGDIYAKHLIYTSKMNLPQALKSYHYLNNKPLQIGKKHIEPISVKGKYRLNHFYIAPDDALITYYLYRNDSVSKSYVLKYDVFGKVTDSIALEDSNKIDKKEYYTYTDKQLAYIEEKYGVTPESKLSYAIINVFKWRSNRDFVNNQKNEEFDYVKKHETLKRQNIVPMYYLDEKIYTTRDRDFDEVPAHFRVFSGEGKLFVDLNVGDAVLHLKTDYEISYDYQRELNTESFYVKKNKESVEAYKDYKLYSHQNLHYHLLYVGENLYIITNDE